jgi:hypothetical protein
MIATPVRNAATWLAALFVTTLFATATMSFAHIL